jgi:hypothetical protein
MPPTSPASPTPPTYLALPAALILEAGDAEPTDADLTSADHLAFAAEVEAAAAIDDGTGY